MNGVVLSVGGEGQKYRILQYGHILIIIPNISLTNIVAFWPIFQLFIYFNNYIKSLFLI